MNDRNERSNNCWKERYVKHYMCMDGDNDFKSLNLLIGPYDIVRYDIT